VLLAAPFTARPADSPATLKDAFKAHFLIGTAVNRSMVTGSATFRRTAEQTAKDVALLKQVVFDEMVGLVPDTPRRISK
jgi:hypothetical protein